MSKIRFVVNEVPFECEPVVKHESSVEFCDFIHENSLELQPIYHTITVTLPIMHDEIPNASLDTLDQQGLEVSEISDEFHINVAKLRVLEFPEHLRELHGWGWADWLDMFNGDTHSAGYRADQIVESKEYSTALWDGSLFFFDELHVHPLFRGYNIGLQLLKHSIVTLSRSLGDFAILFARPIKSIYNNSDSSAIKDQAILTDYYARAGFKVVERRDEGAALMEMYIGAGR